MLKNATGSYCYRFAPRDAWHLGKDFNTNHARIVAKEGPLPVGARTWRCWVRDNEFEDGTLTVGLLVRLPSRRHTSHPPCRMRSLPLPRPKVMGITCCAGNG